MHRGHVCIIPAGVRAICRVSPAIARQIGLLPLKIRNKPARAGYAEVMRIKRDMPQVLTAEPQTVQQIAARMFGQAPTRAQVDSVRRAAKALARSDKARISYQLVDGRRHLVVRALNKQERQMTELQAKVRAFLMHECAACERLFAPKRLDAVYCSNACRQRAYRRNMAMLADAKAGRIAPVSYRGKFYGRDPESLTEDLSEPPERVEDEGPLTDREWQLVGEGKLYVPEART